MQEKKEKPNENDHNYQKTEGKHMEDGVFVSKKSLWLIAGGALGALTAIGIGKASKKIRPALVGAVKEGYTFKEWAAGKIETVKEDVEDIIAEAKHAYHKDLEATKEAIKKEREILEKVEEVVEKKSAKKKKAKEGQ